MIKQIGQKWRSMPTRKKQMSVIGLVVGGVLVCLMVFDGDDKSAPIFSDPDANDEISVLTTNNARDAGIAGLSSAVRELKQSVESTQDKMATLTRNVNSRPATEGQIETMSKALQDMRKQLKRLEEEREATNASSGTDTKRSPSGNSQAPGVGSLPRTSDAYNSPQEDYKVPSNPMASWNPSSEQGDGFAGTSNGTATGAGRAEETSGATIRMVTQMESPSDAEASKEKTDEDDPGAFLPAGSIISGVLLTGMDAPTGNGARQDPFPATIRINKEAILPNRFRADVKECFMLVSGHGDLSSERAYLRSETISCVRNDGGVIEAGLKGYVAGEDGKAGIRGRLVSKQGAMIAKSLMAGFISGASEAFDVEPVPIISTDTGGDNYRSNFDPKMFQGAAASGASGALDRIAQFYIDMAEGMYPVIEIGAGRQIDIIVTQGTQLRIQG